MIGKAALGAAWTAVFLLMGPGGAGAQTISLHALMVGSAVVPRTPSDAFADAQFTFDRDTRRLEYFVNYDGLSPAKLDIHGPAAPDGIAAAIATLGLSPSPVSGATTLTAAQAGDLLAGKLYIDAHSDAFPGGEIRGQIIRQ